MWEAIQANWRSAPLEPKLRATLAFLETMTLRPGELGAADVDAVRAAGVGDEALVDAIHVCALFNMIVRLADSLGWDVPTEEQFAGRARPMLEGSYVLAHVGDGSAQQHDRRQAPAT